MALKRLYHRSGHVIIALSSHIRAYQASYLHDYHTQQQRIEKLRTPRPCIRFCARRECYVSPCARSGCHIFRCTSVSIRSVSQSPADCDIRFCPCSRDHEYTDREMQIVVSDAVAHIHHNFRPRRAQIQLIPYGLLALQDSLARLHHIRRHSQHSQINAKDYVDASSYQTCLFQNRFLIVSFARLPV